MARGKSTVVSSLARTESLLVLLQTGFHHQARGPNASTKVEPANDCPFPRSVLIQMSTQLVMSNHRAGFRRQTAAAGPLPFKAKEFVSMLPRHMTVLRQGRALRAPEVMLDDAVQAHPGCLRLRRLWRTQRWRFHSGWECACLTKGGRRLPLDRTKRVHPCNNMAPTCGLER